MASSPPADPTSTAERRASADQVGRFDARTGSGAPGAPGAPPTGWTRWAFALVPAVAVAELLAQAVVALRVPRPQDWREAHDYIASTHHPDDLVTSAPPWTDPLARQYLADLIPLRDAARPDATRYPRALVATLHGAPHPDLVGWREAGSRSFGPVTVRTLVNPAPARVLYDFADHLRPPEAEVSRLTETPRACAFVTGMVVPGGGLGQGALAPPDRFTCGEGWNYVGVTVIEDMAHRGRRCIWSHPIADGAMVTRFPAVPIGTVIHGHHGIAYEAERGDDLGNVGAPVELRVLVDGTEVATEVHRDWDGWKGFSIDTRRYAGGVHAVTFEVRSDNTAMRHYCFEGDTR